MAGRQYRIEDTFHSLALAISITLSSPPPLPNSPSYRDSLSHARRSSQSTLLTVRARSLHPSLFQLLTPLLRGVGTRTPLPSTEFPTIPARQQRRSPESRAHHFISMINTLHFMRIILRPLSKRSVGGRAREVSLPKPQDPRRPTPSLLHRRSSPPKRHIRGTQLYLTVLVVRNPTTPSPSLLL